ncbi:PP2C family protein-serine/threonine phosphatase [Thiocapsa marina]|uniref:Protein serine/threonine phosphatase n=1 Tax=Thiocapsa marina 5811 TaxID=768671 RepID=F9UEM6_9GAMM|nr:protein phosphatase 2C domain-containing protein [Thiocapsa marina]EGV17347.1 protein serine/threonine phosphatase [Thiocapsa marina 5811]
MTVHTLEYAWRTDRGRVRTGNEDAVAVDPVLGFLIVADGIGGARAGEVASALAAEVIARRFRQHMAYRLHPDAAEAFVESAIQDANVAIWTLSKAEADLSGMGTTVVVGVVGDDWLAFGYVGDSRLYRLRDGRLEQLSRDHSFIQEVVDQGFFNTREDARRYGIGANILTRALGSSSQVKVACGVADLARGDIFLFCTDGLTGMVPEDWLCQVLTASFGNDLEPAAEALVRLANERGGNDNITLALLRVGEPLRDSV